MRWFGTAVLAMGVVLASPATNAQAPDARAKGQAKAGEAKAKGDAAKADATAKGDEAKAKGEEKAAEGKAKGEGKAAEGKAKGEGKAAEADAEEGTEPLTREERLASLRADEDEKHARNLAKIVRIEELAAKKNDSPLTERAKKMRAQEDARHTKAVANLDRKADRAEKGSPDGKGKADGKGTPGTQVDAAEGAAPAKKASGNKKGDQ